MSEASEPPAAAAQAPPKKARASGGGGEAAAAAGAGGSSNTSSMVMSLGTFLVVGAAVLGAFGFKGRVTTVGIDLGTTFSVVAYSHYGKVTVVTDKEYNLHIRRKLGAGSGTNAWYEQEHSIFPSIVSFMNDGQSVVGYGARERMSDDPRNTIFNAKRFIGRSLDEPEVQAYAASHPFRAVAVGNGTTTFGSVGFNLSVSGHTDLSTKAMRATLTKKKAPWSIGSSSSSSSGSSSGSGSDAAVEPAPETPWGSLVSPEYVGSLVLKHLLSLVSYHLGHSMVKSAIIAVPAKFGPAQRQATGQAYKAAGLRVLRVVDEPTAAAVAYKLHKRSNIHHILVYDFGGGTLDVSLLYVSRGSVQVYATDGDEGLGGSDFDLCLYSHLLRRLEREHGFVPPAKSAEAAAGAGGSKGGSPAAAGAQAGQRDHLCSHSALQQKAEQLKKDLSAAESATVSCSIPAPGSGSGAAAEQQPKQVQLQVTRDEFHSTCQGLFDRGLAPVTRLLAELDMTPEHVDEVVLVGGTTRVPRVKQLLRDYFGKPLNDHIDPDVTVAVGAATILD